MFIFMFCSIISILFIPDRHNKYNILLYIMLNDACIYNVCLIDITLWYRNRNSIHLLIY